MPWLGQPWRLTGPFLNAGHFHTLEHLSRLHIADLEPQKVIDVDKAE